MGVRLIACSLCWDLLLFASARVNRAIILGVDFVNCVQRCLLWVHALAVSWRSGPNCLAEHGGKHDGLVYHCFLLDVETTVFFIGH